MNFQFIHDEEAYLKASFYINSNHPSIITKAEQLTGINTTETAKHCFEFVRDQISHSIDSKKDGFSCKASNVLANGHGFCYAKSHLLAALLRANNIPAGLCYQRLTISDFPEENEPLAYCLHGLVAVQLPEIFELNKTKGWYRIDPRGNKFGVNAQFTPPIEQLAFDIKAEGEKDFSQVFSEPLPIVTQVLDNYSNHKDICNALPDAMEITAQLKY